MYNRYRIIKEQDDPTVFVEEIRLLNPALNIEGYLSRPEAYQKHREVVLDLSHYLWHHRELLKEPMSCQERSFSIWGQEKFPERNLIFMLKVRTGITGEKEIPEQERNLYQGQCAGLRG